MPSNDSLADGASCPVASTTYESTKAAAVSAAATRTAASLRPNGGHQRHKGTEVHKGFAKPVSDMGGGWGIDGSRSSHRPPLGMRSSRLGRLVACRIDQGGGHRWCETRSVLRASRHTSSDHAEGGGGGSSAHVLTGALMRNANARPGEPPCGQVEQAAALSSIALCAAAAALDQDGS